jgi:hypothetical protein
MLGSRSVGPQIRGENRVRPPTRGGGVRLVPPAGAHVVCETTDTDDLQTLVDVRLIAYSDGEYDTIRDAAEAVRFR